MGERLERLATSPGASGVLAALTAAVYLPGALAGGFLNDDRRFIVDNPFVHAPDSLLRAFTDPTTTDAAHPEGIVRPLRTLEFALDHALGSGSATVFHLHSVAWHVVATLLLFALLRRLTGVGAAAWLGAALWGLHPMQTESVAFVSSRGDVAMGACAIGSLLLALRSSGRDRFLAGSLALSGIAMLYKETALVLPALVVALRVARPAGDAPPGNLLRALRSAIPWLVVAVAYWIYRESVRIGTLSHVDFALGGSLAGTVSTMQRGFGAYLLFAVFPCRPGFDWFLPVSRTLADPGSLAWMAVHAGLLVWALRARRSHPLAAAGIAVFYLGLVPAANWPVHLGIPTVERFLYLPLVGLALAAAGLLSRRGDLVRPVATAVAAMALVTFARARLWADEDALLAATLRSHDSPRGLAFEGRRIRDRAWDGIRPRIRETADPAGRARLEDEYRATLEDSLDHLERGLAAWRAYLPVWPAPGHPVSVPLVDAANVALLLGRHEDALRFAQDALATDPSLPAAHYNRLWALLELGRARDLLAALEGSPQESLPMTPLERVQFHGRTGRLLAAEGDREAAVAAYRRALDVGLPGRATDAVRRELDDLLRGGR